jgi:cytochrome c556
MRRHIRGTLLTAAALAGLVTAPLAISHYDDKEPLQSYRQSFFTLMAANFGPMVAMVKGEMPWDDDKMAAFADDLEELTELDLLRGFAPGSDKGTTRAKPEIWENMDDFKAKFADLQEAADALDDLIEEGGDREAIAAAVAKTGEACKACHDEYKAKDYLY